MYQSKRSPLLIFISLAACDPHGVRPGGSHRCPCRPGYRGSDGSRLQPSRPRPRRLAATEAPISVENTLTIDSNIDDLITLDPAVVYEYSGILVAPQCVPDPGDVRRL